MSLKNLKRKKNAPSHVSFRFPLPFFENSNLSIFNGHGVSIYHEKVINAVHSEGYFGKGSLSKSTPRYLSSKDDIPMIITEQQWENHAKWRVTEFSVGENERERELSLYSISNFFHSTFSLNQDSWQNWKPSSENRMETDIKTTSLGHVFLEQSQCDCSSDLDDFRIDTSFASMVEQILHSRLLREELTPLHQNKGMVMVRSKSPRTDPYELSSIKVKLKKRLLFINESLKLNLPETFFLKFALGCLIVLNRDKSEMTSDELWKSFCAADINFVEKYIAYHNYRAFGWIVKSGLKFGGDYLLYKDGPAHYHASHLVWLINQKKKMTWTKFVALNRLAETFNKNVLFCQIIKPDGEISTRIMPNALPGFSILHIVTKRWVPAKEREKL